MDTQRCQNYGPVRLLVPLLEFNQVGKNARACESGRRKADAPRPNRDRSPEPPIAERSPHAGTWWRCAASCERRGHWWRAGDAYRPYPVTVGDWSVCPPFKLESSTVPSVIVTPEGIPEREEVGFRGWLSTIDSNVRSNEREVCIRASVERCDRSRHSLRVRNERGLRGSQGVDERLALRNLGVTNHLVVRAHG